MKIRFECKHEEELAEAAEILVNYFSNFRIFALFGDMGVGKTTYIKAIAKELGVQEPTQSPTFGLVNEYLGKNRKKIYHFDLYRIESIDELLAIGFEEYLHSGHYCFIEWPEKVLDILPLDYVQINMNEHYGTRIIDMKAAETTKAVNQ